jgi:hypothetical protein
MTVNAAMPYFACNRHGLVAVVGALGLAIQANLRGLGYGG